MAALRPFSALDNRFASNRIAASASLNSSRVTSATLATRQILGMLPQTLHLPFSFYRTTRTRLPHPRYILSSWWDHQISASLSRQLAFRESHSKGWKARCTIFVLRGANAVSTRMRDKAGRKSHVAVSLLKQSLKLNGLNEPRAGRTEGQGKGRVLKRQATRRMRRRQVGVKS